MNRKFRELIPLFAIALMIIGAVALLIVMNSDSSKKKTTNKETKTVTTNEVSEDEENKVDEPVISADETNDETEETEEKSESVTTVVTPIKTVSETTKTTTTANDDASYISNMVNNIMGSTTTKTTTTTNTTTTNSSSNVTKIEPVVTTTPVATTTTTTPVVTTNTTTTTTQTITQSKTQTAKATAYVIKKSVVVGSYTVAVTSNNNLICYNTNSKIITSTDNIPSTAGPMAVYSGKVYISVPSQSSIRVYSVSNGKLVKEVNTNVTLCEDFIVTTNYVFCLRETESGNRIVVAYKITNGIMESAQSGILGISGGVQSLVSAQGNNITIKNSNGKSITYVFNGVQFDIK